MDENTKKTGTTTVGIVCKDSVILAADKKATAGYLIADKDVKKVVKLNDYTAVTTAGSVSEIQLLTKWAKAEINLKKYKSNKDPSVKEEANLLGGLVYSKIRSYFPGIAHFILAGNDKEGNHLYDIYPDGSLSLHKKFVASGSGSVMAYGVLETLYKEGLSTEEGIKLAIKAINAAIQRDIASGEGIDIYTISEEGVKKVYSKKIETRLE